MNVTFEQTIKKEVSIEVENGYYQMEAFYQKAFRVKGNQVLMISYEPNPNQDLLLDSKIEFMSIKVFAKVYLSNCEPSNRTFFSELTEKVLIQIENIL